MAGLNLIPVRAVRQTAKKAVLRLNYLAGRYTETVWLIGDGRSGTTWISNVIGVSRGYREVFEPFHPGSVAEFRFMPLNLYRAPDQDDQRLEAAAARVFDGRFMHPSSDRDNRRRLLYRGLLVKDVFAMLFARWATLRFPQVKPVLVIRNPFAVARSKRARRGWHWMENPTDFLRQPRLVVDHLADKSDVLRQVEAKKMIC